MHLLSSMEMTGSNCTLECPRVLKHHCQTFPTTPFKFVVETPAGYEDKVYLSHVKIQLLNGIDLPIRTHELQDAVKILGFYHFLDSLKSDHVKEMIKIGIGWVDRMKTGKLLRRDAWMSFFTQLVP